MKIASKFKVYTKTGDDGTSSLYNLERRKKSDLTFEALGDCDETNVAVGIARVHARDFFFNNNSSTTSTNEDNCFDEDVLPHLEIIQSRLLDVGSAVATPMTSEKTKDGMKMRCRFDESHVDAIESWIDAYEEELPALTNFLCPGGTKFAAFFTPSEGDMPKVREESTTDGGKRGRGEIGRDVLEQIVGLFVRGGESGESSGRRGRRVL